MNFYRVWKHGIRELTNVMGSPDVLQVDTIQNCNANCVYCNPQHEFGLSGGRMSLGMAEKILKRVSKVWKYDVSQFRPYMNGEPGLHDELREICDLGKYYFPWSKTVILTNGIQVKSLPLDAEEISFTISAATPETYRIVHGVPKFREVINNLRYIHNNKSPNCELHVSFVANRFNFSELEAWRKMVSDVGHDIFQDVSPIHNSVSQKSSQRSIALNNDEAVKLATVCSPLLLRRWQACNCYNNLAIGLNGELLTCCDLSYIHSVGNIFHGDLKALWRKRCASVVHVDDDCLSCNLRNPNLKQFY